MARGAVPGEHDWATEVPSLTVSAGTTIEFSLGPVRSWVAHLQDHLSADGGRSFPGPFCSTDTLKRPSVQSHSHPPAPIRESQEQHGMLAWTRHSWTWHQPSWNCYLQIPSYVWSHVILRFISNVLLPKDTKRRNWAIYKVIWKGCSRLFHRNCQNGCARFHSHQQQRNFCCLRNCGRCIYFGHFNM